MSAEAPSISRSWSVGRYTCTLTVPKAGPNKVASAVIEWSPGFPDSLTSAQRAAYRHGRDAAIAEVAATLGVNTAVIDL